ncbi:MAG: tripartite tricarboxylate transporter substrate binding protein [Betaproteobacteria bacterium]|nr:tripartite tricarboxylate transporter substrate binding protein [Betaproteobacteria bacterium]
MNYLRPMIHCAAALLALCPTLAFTQAYPVKPLRMIIPYAAGGAADAAGRIIAARLADGLRQPVVVENRAGAGTTIGAAVVASSSPDGYNILMAGLTGHIVSGILYKNLSYDAIKSFTATAQMSVAPFILVVNAASEVRAPRELVDLSRLRPKGLTYGSSGTGAGPHLATEIFIRATGANLIHVPYKGSAPAMQAVLAGEVDTAILDLSAMTQVQSGKLIALALTTAQRSALAPGIPTMAEAGIKGVDVPSGQGLLTPAGTPREIVMRINAVVNQALNSDEVKKAFMAIGFTPAPATPEAFAAFLASEMQKYSELIKRLNVTIE